MEINDNFQAAAVFTHKKTAYDTRCKGDWVCAREVPTPFLGIELQQ
jgi:hypothetical protein